MSQLTAILPAWSKRALLSLAALLLALAAGEIFVRVLGMAPQVIPIELSSTEYVYQRSPNPQLGYVMKANFHCDKPDFFNQFERTNSHGLRDKERHVEKPPGTRRVLLLGDSVVQGIGIRETETISRQLENLLTSENTEVLSFGVSGYSTRAEVELLETKGLAFKPDVVVLVFVENDFQNFSRELFVMGSMDRPYIVKQLFLHCALFRLAAIRWNLWQFRSEAGLARGNGAGRGVSNVVEGLRRLSELSQQHGFVPLIAIWPQFTNDSVVDCHPLRSGGGELVIEHLGKMFRIPAVRLSPAFASDQASQPPGANPRLRYTTADGMHPSAEGGRIAALALNEHLTRLRSGALTQALAAHSPGSSNQDAEALKEALALSGQQPGTSENYTNVGVGLLDTGRAETAIEYFRMALRVDPESETAHLNWGYALQGLGRHEEAVEHYRQALRIKPNFALAQNNWGNALYSQGHMAEASKHYQEALRIDPDYAEAHSNLGASLAAQGKIPEAIKHFEEALRLQPELATARNNLQAIKAAKDQGEPTRSGQSDQSK